MIALANKEGGGYDGFDVQALEALSVAFVEALSRKRAQEQLRRAYEELENRVMERTAELAGANKELRSYTERLELLNQELRDFAFAASHDLQEPLRKIQTFACRISSKHAMNLDEEGRDFLERMQKTANRMSSLLEALRRYTRATTCSLPFTATDLTILAEDAVSNLEDIIDQTGARIEIEKLPRAEVDPLQIRQLFQHLIGNAIKYTKGREPEIRVSGEVLEDGASLISIEDNGIGFEEHFLQKLFAPFQRLHGRNSPFEGVGIGLAICRKIVERHRGTITARSAPGKGSTFIITLPLKQLHKYDS